MLREVLKELIRADPTLAQNGKRLERILKDRCPTEKARIKVLMKAYREGVVAELQMVGTGTLIDSLLGRLTRRLHEEATIREDLAQWAVENWALALGVIRQPAVVVSPPPPPPRVAPAPRPMPVAPTPSLPPPPVSRSKANWFGWLVALLPKGEPWQPDPRQQQAAAALKLPVVFRDRLADGTLGPEMVVIPTGEFMMGSPASESGRWDRETQHRVIITQPFAMCHYEVTFAEYDAFCEATGRQKPDDSGWGRDDRPVINVDWNDAVAYTEWLTQKTEQKYRLPTEAE